MRRWELIFGRINLKKNTKYDFRDVQVKLYRNLPTDKYTETDSALKLQGLLSDERVISMLPQELDPISELQKKSNQDEQAIKDNIENMVNVNNQNMDSNLETQPKEEIENGGE